MYNICENIFSSHFIHVMYMCVHVCVCVYGDMYVYIIADAQLLSRD